MLIQDEKWDPANPRGHTTTATMTAREFNAWCDAGHPPLKPKPQTDAQKQRAWDQQFDARLNSKMLAFAEGLGKEFGIRERELRANFKRETEALRAEIEKLRGASAVDLVGLANKIGKSLRNDEPVDLPSEWRLSHGKH
jgi:hypothetical protein